MSWPARTLLCALLFLITLVLIAPLGFGANNFVLIRLPHGVRLEIPRNWAVLSPNQRITLDTAVQSRNEPAGFFDASSDLNFAANYFDDAGKTTALVNIRYYPDLKITQAEARTITASDISEFDIELRNLAKKSAQINGFSILAWYGTKKQTFNGATAFVTEYKRSPIKNNGNFRIRLVRIFNYNKSFTLTVSYREDQQYLLKPICDRIIASLHI